MVGRRERSRGKGSMCPLCVHHDQMIVTTGCAQLPKGERGKGKDSVFPCMRASS